VSAELDRPIIGQVNLGEGSATMPMIDVYAGAAVFDDKKGLCGHAHTNTELVQAARSKPPQTAETSTAAEA
jgi:hypothetical protein